MREIDDWRIGAGLTDTAFVKWLGLSGAAYSRHRNGSRGLSVEAVRSYYSFFKQIEGSSIPAMLLEYVTGEQLTIQPRRPA